MKLEKVYIAKNDEQSSLRLVKSYNNGFRTIQTIINSTQLSFDIDPYIRNSLIITQSDFLFKFGLRFSTVYGLEFDKRHHSLIELELKENNNKVNTHYDKKQLSEERNKSLIMMSQIEEHKVHKRILKQLMPSDTWINSEWNMLRQYKFNGEQFKHIKNLPDKLFSLNPSLTGNDLLLLSTLIKSPTKEQIVEYDLFPELLNSIGNRNSCENKRNNNFETDLINVDQFMFSYNGEIRSAFLTVNKQNELNLLLIDKYDVKISWRTGEEKRVRYKIDDDGNYVTRNSYIKDISLNITGNFNCIKNGYRM